MSGWETSNRRQGLPADWAARVKAVHRRSGGICERRKSNGRRCTNPADGGVDHAVDPDNHKLGALADLCRWHHNAKTAIESKEGKEKRAAAIRRDPESHPGLRRG